MVRVDGRCCVREELHARTHGRCTPAIVPVSKRPGDTFRIQLAPLGQPAGSPPPVVNSVPSRSALDAGRGPQVHSLQVTGPGGPVAPARGAGKPDETKQGSGDFPLPWIWSHRNRSQWKRAYPNRSQPNRSQPNGSQPNGSQPNGSQPNGSQPNGSQPNGSQPNGSQPSGGRRDSGRDFVGAMVPRKPSRPGVPVVTPAAELVDSRSSNRLKFSDG